jgi:hypothetical protein
MMDFASMFRKHFSRYSLHGSASFVKQTSTYPTRLKPVYEHVAKVGKSFLPRPTFFSSPRSNNCHPGFPSCIVSPISWQIVFPTNNWLLHTLGRGFVIAHTIVHESGTGDRLEILPSLGIYLNIGNSGSWYLVR